MNRILAFALGTGALIVPTGCRILPHEDPPKPQIALPTDWIALPDEASPEAQPGPGWWRELGDADLTSAIEEALVANPDVRTSAARVAQAAAEARIAGADRLPTLGLSGSFQRQKQIFVGLPVPGGDVLQSQATTYGVSLDLNWEADLWGRLAALEQAAESDLAASAADYRAALESLAAQTAKAWFAWQEARLQVALAERTLATFERTRELVSRRFETGAATALDLSLAEADVAAQRALAEDRREDVDRTVRQLELLLGRYPAGSMEAEAVLPDPPPPPPPGVPGQLIARRPDLVAAEARLGAASDRLYAARANLYPRLSLGGSLGTTSNEAGDLVDPDFSVWRIAANLAQPLFEGGRLRAGVDLADAQVETALHSFEAALLAALGDVETALAAEGSLLRLEAAQALAAERAEAARALAEERYAAGVAELLDVLEAQRRALSAASTHLDVRRRRLENRVDLHLALGGGFESREDAQ